MVYLVWTLALPGELTQNIPFLRFLFDHPAHDAPVMDLFDIGTPAFMFVLGLSLSIAFWRYAEKKGIGLSLLRVIFRYAFLLAVGYILELGQNGWAFAALIKEKAIPITVILGKYTISLNVLWWDVIIALGLIGLTAIPFIFIRNPWIRIVIAYIPMFVYQVLLMLPFTSTYFYYFALESVHSGIFVSLFTFTTVTVIGTALGDYMFSNKDSKKKQYITLAIFGVVNVALGIGLGFIPGLYWSKQIGTATYGLVSIGVITLGCLVFILMDEKLNWKLKYLVMFGMNPLLSYVVAELIYQLPDMLFTITELWLKLIIWGVIIVVVSLMNWLLYRKKKYVKTEWVTLAFLILIVALSFVI
jgi:predicted acyltransferase